jgi:hypothetical protein
MRFLCSGGSRPLQRPYVNERLENTHVGEARRRGCVDAGFETPGRMA